MTNRTHILNELESIAPVLVKAPVPMPYLVPEGYFETFPADILHKLGLNEMYALAPHIVMAPKENLYDVPVGYFHGLADIVLDKIHPQENKDTLPVGYFESFPGILLYKIRGLKVQNELAELAPLLNSINKQPVNFVPPGYFETLDVTIPQSNDEAAKVVSIKKRNGWMKYAVAACITGAIAFTTFNIIGKDTGGGGTVLDVNIPQELAKLDDATIENYLTKEETLAGTNTVAYQEVKDDDIKDFLQEFSDEELVQYLENEGEITGNN